MTSSTLTPEQAHALFDILTHEELYSEIEGFKSPEAIRNYGYPFKETSGPPSSPTLQMLFTSFILKIPFLKTLPSQFWQERISTLMANLGEAELSESYDKGAMGTRKTLSTASSAILESVMRGCLGGCPAPRQNSDHSYYDHSKAEELQRAWEDAAHELVCGDLIDELFDGAARTPLIEKMPPLSKAAIDHMVLQTASFMHYVFVLSPDGQYLLRLLTNTYRLIPFLAIRQTLRVGNAATMINGMLKLLLTKLSFTAVTNWMGFSKSADDGMNLLQQIISQVLAWDNSDFKAHAVEIENAKNGPSKEYLNAIQSHTEASRETHEQVRSISIERSTSIVQVVFESGSLPPLADSQHAQALEYYSAKLSIRDRKELIRVFCREYPDQLTGTIRDVVAVYDPLIRSVHNGVDLSAGMADMQAFLDDMVKVVKPKPEREEKAPSVEEFVGLLKRHIPSITKFLHLIAKNCPDISGSFRAFCKDAIKSFRATNPDAKGGAGSMTPQVESLFSTLPEDQQQKMRGVLDAHAEYLSSLDRLSTQRAQSVLDNNSVTLCGPGIYLARWNDLLDNTLITPATVEGTVRRGKDIHFSDEGGKKKAGAKGWWDSEAIARKVMRDRPQQPDVEIVKRLLGLKFKEMLGNRRLETVKQ